MPTRRTEEQLAQVLNDEQQTFFLRKRQKSIVWLLAGITTATFSALLGFEFGLLASVTIALVATMFYFDANSNLHELRRHPRKTLAPHFSVFDPTPASPTADSSGTKQRRS